jgi:hypothetical protein
VFARLHTLEATPAQAERGDEIIGTDFLPWARESTGFCGLIRLVNNQSGKALVLTLWADEQALQASAAASDRLRLLITQASGAAYRSVEDFEVSLLDIQA